MKRRFCASQGGAVGTSHRPKVQNKHKHTNTQPHALSLFLKSFPEASLQALVRRLVPPQAVFLRPEGRPLRHRPPSTPSCAGDNGSQALRSTSASTPPRCARRPATSSRTSRHSSPQPRQKNPGAGKLDRVVERRKRWGAGLGLRVGGGPSGGAKLKGRKRPPGPCLVEFAPVCSACHLHRQDGG